MGKRANRRKDFSKHDGRCRSCERAFEKKFFIRSHGFRNYKPSKKLRFVCNLCAIRKMISRRILSLKGIDLEDFSLFEILCYMEVNS